MSHPYDSLQGHNPAAEEAVMATPTATEEDVTEEETKPTKPAKSS